MATQCSHIHFAETCIYDKLSLHGTFLYYAHSSLHVAFTENFLLIYMQFLTRQKVFFVPDKVALYDCIESATV